jgi:hypothetical protein
MPASMDILPTWMRRGLLATGVMNVVVSFGFVPAAAPVRTFAGLPASAPPVYLLTIAIFILAFGLGYLWLGATGRPERILISIAAFGKLSFVALLAGAWAAGGLPLRAPVLASADLFFAALFIAWLLGSRGAV